LSVRAFSENGRSPSPDYGAAALPRLELPKTALQMFDLKRNALRKTPPKQGLNGHPMELKGVA